MHYWREHNPYDDAAVYVPLEEMAECVAGGWIGLGDGTTVRKTPEFVYSRWIEQYGERLDAYVLPQPNGRHLLGVRYGSEGSQYLSSEAGDPEKVEALLRRYSNEYAVSLPTP